ncbi:unnamed protein product [Phytophthora lilii]|uniref:Unnamed protein product n=1 Tax=Phytophthora lilii TaxID=2077276 RepID=A0A9W6YGE5_9STRA|nr:unnamed protein product [Phytophthora lilii]
MATHWYSVPPRSNQAGFAAEPAPQRNKRHDARGRRREQQQHVRADGVHAAADGHVRAAGAVPADAAAGGAAQQEQAAGLVHGLPRAVSAVDGRARRLLDPHDHAVGHALPHALPAVLVAHAHPVRQLLAAHPVLHPGAHGPGLALQVAQRLSAALPAAHHDHDHVHGGLGLQLVQRHLQGRQARRRVRPGVLPRHGRQRAAQVLGLLLLPAQCAVRRVWLENG